MCTKLTRENYPGTLTSPSSRLKKELFPFLKNYRFSLETEFILRSKITGGVFWYPELSFADLHDLLDSIDLSGIPYCLPAETAYKKLMPYRVSGHAIFVKSDEFLAKVNFYCSALTSLSRRPHS
ncbi:MAG: hypothetical protein A2X86_11900 [Bdellovibrionales bacterium GWA2_49_15]|nr:MAG: hypothetical protein A2X86_11900 [Bdellovibrionales bacterium GWA2_49_15]